jgi:hypothetical protein
LDALNSVSPGEARLIQAMPIENRFKSHASSSTLVLTVSAVAFHRRGKDATVAGQGPSEALQKVVSRDLYKVDRPSGHTLVPVNTDGL